MKRFLIPLIKLAISISILSWLFSQAINDEQFSSLKDTKKNWFLLLSAFAWTGAGILTTFFRWRIVANSLGMNLPVRDAVRIGLMGQFFNVFTFGTLGGDGVRAFYLSKTCNKKMSLALASVIADRFIGLFTMFVIAGTAFLILNRLELIAVEPRYAMALNTTGKLILAGAFLGMGVLAALMLIPHIERQGWFRRLISIRWLGNSVIRLLAIMALFRKQPRVLVNGFLLSLLVNFCFAVSMYSISRGLGNTVPSLPNHGFIEPLAMVCNAVPLPGGLGGMEFTLSVLYRAFENPNGVVVAFAYRLTLLVIAALGGMVWLLNRGENGNQVR